MYGPLPVAWPVTEDIKMPSFWPVTKDKARYQGEIVAVVVAESAGAARDGGDAVEVDYEPLPALVDVEKAQDADAPILHEDLGTNASYTWALTNGDVDKAFADSPVIVKARYYLPRLIPNAMEPRGCVGASDAITGQLTLWTSTQIRTSCAPRWRRSCWASPRASSASSPRVGGGFDRRFASAPRKRRPWCWRAG
jgi:carbon-monoxide dehydrogenase large subunit